MKSKIRVGDEVLVIAGSDKGRQGSVLAINIGKEKVKVQNVRIQTVFDKKEGIQKREGFIHFSNVKLVKKAEKTTPKKKSKKDDKKNSSGFFSKSK